MASPCPSDCTCLIIISNLSAHGFVFCVPDSHGPELHTVRHDLQIFQVPVAVNLTSRGHRPVIFGFPASSEQWYIFRFPVSNAAIGFTFIFYQIWYLEFPQITCGCRRLVFHMNVIFILSNFGLAENLNPCRDSSNS
ncbi:hypothetical protein BJ912DRAFT_928482 [Pholiota molesta]|nr:hypothetical protein BJ912DRAFT_928482 [Pholiota molesta]